MGSNGILGGATSFLFGNGGAQGAQGAAMAQLASAQQTQQQALGYLGNAMPQAMSLAQATPQELNALGQSYGAASQNVQQQQQLMASIDPALMQASQQAMNIMQGGTASLNAPMMDQRNQQRAQLQNSLNAQYGPGSQIAQQQLNNFDTQTNSMFQQNQLGALSTYGGYQNQGMQASQGAMGSALSQLMGVGQGYQNIQNTQLQTQQQNTGMYMNALMGTGQQITQNAGAPYVGQMMQGQMGTNILGGALGGLASGVGQGLGKGWAS